MLTLPKKVVQQWCSSQSEPPPIPRPTPAKFNLANAIERLTAVFQTCEDSTNDPQSFWPKEMVQASLQTLDLPLVLSSVEAQFWIFALLSVARLSRLRELNLESATLLIEQLQHFQGKDDIDLWIQLAHLRLRYGSGAYAHYIPAQLPQCLLNVRPCDRLISDLYHAGQPHHEALQCAISDQIEESEIKLYHSHNSHLNRQQAIEKVIERSHANLRDQVMEPLLGHILDTYSMHFWCYRTDSEVDSLKEFLSANMLALRDHRCRRSLFALSLKLGMQDQLMDLLNSQTKGTWWHASHRFSLFEIALHLKEPKDILAQIERLQLRPRTPEELLGYLARLHGAGLDYLADCILKTEGRKNVKQLMAALGRAKGPEMAVCMLRLSLETKTAEAAKAWLRKHPGPVIDGLVPIAGEQNRRSKAALRILQDLRIKGHTRRLEAAIKQQSEARANRLYDSVLAHAPTAQPETVQFDDQSTPAWLAEAIATMKTTGTLKPLPKWLPIDYLPSVRMGDVSLNDQQIAAFVSALRVSTLETPHDFVCAVKSNAVDASVQAFVNTLFDRWQKEDMPSAEKWVMWAAAHLESKEVATKLGPLTVKWRKQVKHVRVNWALDTLTAMNSDASLMQLHYISQKAHRPNLRARATKLLKVAAARQGITASELNDRMIPDCGLNASGQKTFNFGKRQFDFVLGSDMKPMVRDGKGKLRANLPKPAKADDPNLAGEAIADWRSLKKQLKAVGNI